MAINYDELPQERPTGGLLEAGKYKADILKAEMKKGSTGSDYMALTYDLTGVEGEKGKLWDNFFDSDKELPRYKLQRLITALNLNLTGSFELKDLCKIVAGKQLIVDVGVDEKNERGPRNTVDVFKDEIYYPISEWASLTGDFIVVSASDAEPDDAVATPVTNTVDEY